MVYFYPSPGFKVIFKVKGNIETDEELWIIIDYILLKRIYQATCVETKFLILEKYTKELLKYVTISQLM